MISQAQPVEVICETCGWDLADTTLYGRPICLKCLQGLTKGAA